jgi:hypothetical protein
MGILERIRRNMRRSTRGTKDSLSIVSTCDETYYIGDQQEESYLLFSDEPLSPHHGVIATSTPVPKSSNKPKQFFDDDLPERDDEQLLGLTENSDCYHLQASDEERDDARLLNSTSTGSGKRSFAYSFDQYEEEEIIFEPSFEVALMDPETLLLDSPLAEKVLVREDVPPKTSPEPLLVQPTEVALDPVPPPKKQPLAKRRYDLYGRPFLHIFHEGLSTLYEESDDGKQEEPVPDDDKIRARWELALEQMNSEGSSDWDGILPQKYGNRSAYEI